MNRNLTTYKSSNSNVCKGILAYRFSFNGKEKTDIDQGVYDFGARLYNAEIGRFFSVDPRSKEYFELSSYCFAANNPIRLIDENGEGPYLRDNKDGTTTLVFDVVVYPEVGMAVQTVQALITNTYGPPNGPNGTYQVQGNPSTDIKVNNMTLVGIEINITVATRANAQTMYSNNQNNALNQTSGTYFESDLNFFEIKAPTSLDAEGNPVQPGYAKDNGGYLRTDVLTNGSIFATKVICDEMLHTGGAMWDATQETDPRFQNKPGEGHHTAAAANTGLSTGTGAVNAATEATKADFTAMEKGTKVLKAQGNGSKTNNSSTEQNVNHYGQASKSTNIP